DIPNAGRLDVEGVQGEEMTTQILRREQVGNVAVAILRANRFRGSLIGIGHRSAGFFLCHSTAIRAAATARSSARRTLKVRTAAPVAIGSATMREARQRSRSGADSRRRSVPVPTRRISMASLSAKTEARFSASRASGAGAFQP